MRKKQMFDQKSGTQVSQKMWGNLARQQAKDMFWRRFEKVSWWFGLITMIIGLSPFTSLVAPVNEASLDVIILFYFGAFALTLVGYCIYRFGGGRSIKAVLFE